MKAITKRDTVWNGRTATKFIEVVGKKFKLKAGLYNGDSDKDAYILGENGWAPFLSKEEIDFGYPYNVSYVCSEQERKEWAEIVIEALEENIVQIFS